MFSASTTVSRGVLEDLLIWDEPDPPPTTKGLLVLWQASNTTSSPRVISIPHLIEERAETLRAYYLSYIHEIGHSKIKGRSVIDFFELLPGLNYWWLSLLVEKSNYLKSPQITDAIRLLAFVEWASNRGITSISLASSSPPLAKTLREFCDERKIPFNRVAPSRPTSSIWSLQRRIGRLRKILCALIWLLRYLLKRWGLRGVGVEAWRHSKGSALFVSYLFNLNLGALSGGRYESHYWGSLPDTMRRGGLRTNWLHLYLADPLIPSSGKAAASSRSLTAARYVTETHVCLDGFLSSRVLRLAVLDWLKLIRVGLHLTGPMRSANGKVQNLWHFLAEDWWESTCGPTAMSNALHMRLFDAAMTTLAPQSIGFYLQENQGWEFAFVQKWRSAKHGQLIGVPHSTVRFWDLRYFFDPRSYSLDGINSLPLPNFVAVNGKAAMSAYLAGGYPTEQLLEVEALRYLRLNVIVNRSSSGQVTRQKNSRILVLGDYLLLNTRLQIALLLKAISYLTNKIEIVIKPHPACPIKPADYHQLTNVQFTEAPLPLLFAKADVAYTGPVTSAAVDAYCAGIPVITFSNPTMLNLSPLRGFDGVSFVSSPEELIIALNKGVVCRAPHPMHQNFFTVDEGLPRWRKLINRNTLEQQL